MDFELHCKHIQLIMRHQTPSQGTKPLKQLTQL